MSDSPEDAFWASLPRLDFDNEASVEQGLLQPLLAALGYESSQVSPKVGVRLTAGSTGRPHEADFVVYASADKHPDDALLIVEAKSPNENLASARFQAQSYVVALRAPLYLLSNGRILEIWQFQPARGSQLLLSAPVGDLAAHRGAIEQYISRDAAVHYCCSLELKPIATAAQDLTPYLTAEMDRVYDRVGIERRLSDGTSARGSDDLLRTLGRGAVIVAASGQGKSWLLSQLLHRAASMAAVDGDSGVPFAINVPDLAALGETIETYAVNRLKAHCPQFSAAAFRDLNRKRGVLLLLDNAHHADETDLRRIAAEIRTLQRDFQKCQAVLFSRSPESLELNLPLLELSPLDRDGQYALAEFLVGNRAGLALYRLPAAYESLAENPLLLTRLLRHWEETAAYPQSLKEIFEPWLEALLGGSGTVQHLRLRSFIASIAVQAALHGGRAEATLRAVDPDGSRSGDLNSLVKLGALRVGPTLSFAHDAVGDYLRAVDLVGREDAAVRLASEPMELGSLYPVLIMSVATTRTIQDAAWARAASLSLETYMDLLRFRGHVASETENGGPPVKSLQIASELLHGLAEPLHNFFPQLETSVLHELSGQTDIPLGICGALSEDGRRFTYAYGPAGPDGPIVIGYPSTGLIHGMGTSGTELERGEGRLHGFYALTRTIHKLIARRRLSGGVHLANERLIGRLRMIASVDRTAFRCGTPLQHFEETLGPDAGQIVIPFGSIGEMDSFLIDEVLEDIRFLRREGRDRLDCWWERYANFWLADDESRIAMAELFSQTWLRAQLVYCEIVSANFNSLAPHLNFYQALPVRFRLNVSQGHFGPSVDHRWEPVVTWEEAGAIVGFDPAAEMQSSKQYNEIMTKLAKLGRKGCTSVSGGFEPAPLFDGDQINGHFNGETAALRKAVEWLQSDLRRLLSRAPQARAGLGVEAFSDF